MNNQPEQSGVENGIRLFIGSHAATATGERVDLTGDRCFSAAHKQLPGCFTNSTGEIVGLLDSGAFTDKPEKRLHPAAALDRQFEWERRASEKYGRAWAAQHIASYDRLIDETWINGCRHKRRWTVQAADLAVRETIENAAYLAGERDRLKRRTLVLCCQGVTPEQYSDCVKEVLRYAWGGDTWIGLGGWCILGREKSLLPSFWKTLYLILPEIARSGIDYVHLFGVLYEPALGGLLWLADRYGLKVSTDSSRVIKDCTSNDPIKLKRAGARARGWRANVAYWQRTLATLRETRYYRSPCPLYEMEEDKRRIDEECWQWVLV